MIVHIVSDNLRKISQLAFAFNQEHKIINNYDELKEYSNVTILMDEPSAKEHYKNPISLDDFTPTKDTTYVIGKNYPDTPFHEQISDDKGYDILYIPLLKPVPLHAEIALGIVLYSKEKNN
jgi:hypothetical protein